LQANASFPTSSNEAHHPSPWMRPARMRTRTLSPSFTVIGIRLLTNQENFAECSDDAGAGLKMANEMSRKK
jgi:hypothetical protein